MREILRKLYEVIPQELLLSLNPEPFDIVHFNEHTKGKKISKKVFLSFKPDAWEMSIFNKYAEDGNKISKKEFLSSEISAWYVVWFNENTPDDQVEKEIFLKIPDNNKMMARCFNNSIKGDKITDEEMAKLEDE